VRGEVKKRGVKKEHIREHIRIHMFYDKVKARMWRII